MPEVFVIYSVAILNASMDTSKTGSHRSALPIRNSVLTAVSLATR